MVLTMQYYQGIHRCHNQVHQLKRKKGWLFMKYGYGERYSFAGFRGAIASVKIGRLRENICEKFTVNETDKPEFKLIIGANRRRHVNSNENIGLQRR